MFSKSLFIYWFTGFNEFYLKWNLLSWSKNRVEGEVPDLLGVHVTFQ